MTFTIQSIARTPSPVVVELLHAWVEESYKASTVGRRAPLASQLRAYRNAEICRKALISAINGAEVSE